MWIHGELYIIEEHEVKTQLAIRRFGKSLHIYFLI